MQTKQEPIVITGVGVVSPIGIGKDNLWSSLKTGSTGFKTISLFDTSNTRSKLAAEITNFNPHEILGTSVGLKNMDRSTKLALCAAKLALDDANLNIDDSNNENIGVILGSTNSSIYSASEFDKQSLIQGAHTVNPAHFPNLVMCGAPSQVSIRFGIKGLCSTVASGPNSGFSAMQYAMKMIECGHIQSALVGSMEELCEQTYKAFNRLELLSGSKNGQSELSAPLDRRRNGFVMGEGAVVFLLETFERAKARQAKIYAKISHVLEEPSFICHNSFRPYLRNLERFISQSIEENQLLYKNIDFISIGANSSMGRDVLEAKIADAILVEEDGSVVSSIKSLLGESFSASISFQIAASLFCMETGCVFPTVGVKKIDSRCYVRNLVQKTISMKVKKSLVCSADLGSPISLMALEKID